MSIENKPSQLEITRPESSPDQYTGEKVIYKEEIHKYKEKTHEREQSMSEVVMQDQEEQYAILQERKSQQEEELKSHDQNVVEFRDRISRLEDQKSKLAEIYDESIVDDFDNVVKEVISQKREKEEQRLQVYNQLGESLHEQGKFRKNLDKLREQYEARSVELEKLDHDLEEKITNLHEHIQTFTEQTENISEKIEKSKAGLKKIQGLAGEATNDAEKEKWNTLIENINKSIAEKEENLKAYTAELNKMEEELQSKKETKENVSQQQELYSKHIEHLKQKSSEINTAVEEEQDARAEKEVSTEDQALDYMIHGISNEEESLDHILYFLDQNFATHGISLDKSTADLAGRALDRQEKFEELARIIREKGPEEDDVKNALQDTVDHIGTVEAQKVQETFIEVLYNDYVKVTSEQEGEDDRDQKITPEATHNTEQVQQAPEGIPVNPETVQRQEENDLGPEYYEQVKKMINILGEDWESRTEMDILREFKGEDKKTKYYETVKTVSLPEDPKEKIDYVLNVQKKEQQDPESTPEATHNDEQDQQNPKAAQGQETYSGTGNEYEELGLTEEKKQRVTEFLGDNWEETNEIQVNMGGTTMTMTLGQDIKQKVEYILGLPETYTAIKQEESNIATNQEESKSETEYDEQVKKMINILGEDWESRTEMKVVKAEKGEGGKKKSEIVHLPKDPKEKIDYVLNVQKKERPVSEQVFKRPKQPETTLLTPEEITQADAILEAANDDGTIMYGGNPYTLPGNLKEDREFVLDLKKNGAGALGNSEGERQDPKNQESTPKVTHNTEEQRKKEQPQTGQNGEPVSVEENDSGHENTDITLKEQEEKAKKQEQDREPEANSDDEKIDTTQEEQENQEEQVEKMKILLGENWESRSFMTIDGPYGHQVFDLPKDDRDQRIEEALRIHNKLVENVLSERSSNSPLTEEEIAKADKILERANKGIVTINDQPYLLPSDPDDQRWFVLALPKKKQKQKK